LKEKIITTISTALTVQEVIDHLSKITVDKYTRPIINRDTQYVGRVNADHAVLRDYKYGSRNHRPNLFLKFHQSDGRTVITISNDSVSRINDAFGYILIMAVPIGICLALAGIYSAIVKSESSYGPVFFGVGLILLPFILRPNVKSKNYLNENEREINRLCKYLEAEIIKSG
jgi:hypothetical protein